MGADAALLRTPSRSTLTRLTDRHAPAERLFTALRWLFLLLRRGAGNRGRTARAPSEIPLVGWRDILLRTWHGLRADRVELLAAGIAFYGFLALLSSLTALTMIYGRFAEPEQVLEHIGVLARVAPDAAQALVVRRIIEVAAGAQRWWEVALAILLAAFGAVRGARATAGALNIVYGETEEANFRQRWMLPLALAAGGAALLLLALAAVGLFQAVEQLLPEESALVWTAVRVGAWLLLLLVVSIGSAGLYRYAPARRPARWLWVTPGAIASALLWLAATVGVGLYLSSLARVDLSYGSLAAVVVLELWLYLSALTLLIGAKINAETERQTCADTTIGEPRAAGARHAASADQLGAIPALHAD